MAKKAEVYLVKSKYDDHDIKCRPVRNKYEADLIAYAVDSKYEDHKLKVCLTECLHDAQATIYLVDSKYLLKYE
jgi:hypothetical protein